MACILISGVWFIASSYPQPLRYIFVYVVTISNLKNKPVFIKSVSTGEIQLTGHNIANIIKEVITHIGINK